MRLHGTRKSCAKNGIEAIKPALEGQGIAKKAIKPFILLGFYIKFIGFDPRRHRTGTGQSPPRPQKNCNNPLNHRPMASIRINPSASILRPLIPVAPDRTAISGPTLMSAKARWMSRKFALTGKTPHPAKPATLTPPLRQNGLRPRRQSTGQKAIIEI